MLANVRRIRLFAIVTLVLVSGYHVMRPIANQCTGAACDVYIPLSLLVPLVVLISAAATSVTALFHARHDMTWFTLLAVCAVLGVLGPLASLIVLRDNPDALVILSTLLILTIPVSALLYSFFKLPTRRPDQQHSA
jgi:cytochrome bd-type quinol oxidase subunit 2